MPGETKNNSPRATQLAEVTFTFYLPLPVHTYRGAASPVLALVGGGTAMVSAGGPSRAQPCFCGHLLTPPASVELGAGYKRGHSGQNDSRPRMWARVRGMGEKTPVLECGV